MKYLITGAAGFIGSHLVEYLMSDGVDIRDIRLFVFRDESLKNLPRKKFDIVRGDIRNISDVEKAIKGIDVVYHLAAVTKDNDGDYYEVNLGGTRNLLKFSANYRKFVFFSSIAVYGLPAFVGSRKNINELSGKKAVGDYAESKYLAEKEVIKESKKNKFTYQIIRPTTVYGPRDRAGIYQLYLAIKNHYFLNIGDEKNKVDYVFVKDVVVGARQAELSKKSEDYIIGSGPIEFNQITNAISNSLEMKLSSIKIPVYLALIIGEFVDLVNVTFRTKIPFSKNRVVVMTSNYYFDIFKARKKLRYSPETGIDEGIKITVSSYEK